MAEFYRKKKKPCYMCAGNSIDYKDVAVLKRFVSGDKKTIQPRRITGLCAEHQRVASTAIKNARFMGLLPFVKN